MAIQLFRCGVPARWQVVCLGLALVCAAYVPMSGAQSVLSLSAAYYLPGGFFIYNLGDGYFFGADNSWFLTEATYDFALAHPQYYLFNLTFNRNIGGPPTDFTSAQYFEINMPSTASATYLQWNVYGWWNPVDMYFSGSSAAGNTLFSFLLVDPLNYFYAIHSQFSNECVAATGGGHLNIQRCQLDNTAQLFQFINPYGPSPAQTQTTVAVSLPTAYVLPQFMVYNVHDNAVVGKAANSWAFQESGNLPVAALDNLFFFNLSFNRAVFGAPTFTEASLFEIMCPATASSTFLEWNVYGFGTVVEMWNVPALDSLQTNLMWNFVLVDELNSLYLIQSNLFEHADDCVTAFGASTFFITPCESTNTSQLFQFINPYNTPTGPVTTTTTKPQTPSSWVEIQCFADSSLSSSASWQSSVKASMIAGVVAVLSSASSAPTAIYVTAFQVQQGTQSNGKYGATVSLVVQVTTAQQARLMQQGGVNVSTSSLNSLLLTSGVGQLSSVQIVSSSNGDIPPPSNAGTSDSSGGFSSQGWQVAVFVIVLLSVLALLLAGAYVYRNWLVKQRHNEVKLQASGSNAVSSGGGAGAVFGMGGKSAFTPLEHAHGTADAETGTAGAN